MALGACQLTWKLNIIQQRSDLRIAGTDDYLAMITHLACHSVGIAVFNTVRRKSEDGEWLWACLEAGRPRWARKLPSTGLGVGPVLRWTRDYVRTSAGGPTQPGTTVTRRRRRTRAVEDSDSERCDERMGDGRAQWTSFSS